MSDGHYLEALETRLDVLTVEAAALHRERTVLREAILQLRLGADETLVRTKLGVELSR